LGFTAVLDAEMSEYYCSSTNGPGFKVGLMGSKYSLSQAISFYHLKNPLISFITQRNALNVVYLMACSICLHTYMNANGKANIENLINLKGFTPSQITVIKVKP